MMKEAARATIHIQWTPATTIWEALDSYEEVFLHPASVELAQKEFEKSKRKTGEALLSFHTRLRFLFRRAYPGAPHETDKRLRDGFTDQLNHFTITKELRLDPSYRTLTYSDLLTRAQNVEANLVHLKDIDRAGGGGRINFMDDLLEGGTSGAGEIQAMGKLECYVCKGPHVMRNCSEVDRLIPLLKRMPGWKEKLGVTSPGEVEALQAKSGGKSKGKPKGKGKNKNGSGRVQELAGENQESLSGNE